MEKKWGVLIISSVLLIAATDASAQQGWGSIMKTAAQTAGQAVIAQMDPQAKAVVDEAKKLGAPAKQENFLVSKAKEFLAGGNYQPALDLANYVITAVNTKSVDAKKIMADAKAALMKIAQDKLTQSQAVTAASQSGQAQVNTAQQIKADASQTVNGVKNLFGKK